MSVLDYPACTACGKHGQSPSPLPLSLSVADSALLPLAASDLKKDAAKDEVSTTPTPTTTTKMLVCSRCQSNANRLVHYCSRFVRPLSTVGLKGRSFSTIGETDPRP